MNVPREPFDFEGQNELFSFYGEFIAGSLYNPKTGQFEGGANVVPCWLARRTEIGGTAKLLYGVLARYCDRRTGFAFPGQSAISEALGITPRAVRKSLAQLEKNNLIIVRTRGNARSNEYGFLLHDWMNDEQ